VIEQPAGIEPVSLVKRVVTGLLFAVFVFGSIGAGNSWFVLPVACAVIAGIAAHEFSRVTRPDMARIPYLTGITLAVLLPVATAFGRLYIETDPVLGQGGLIGLAVPVYLATGATFVYATWASVTPTSRIADAAFSLFGALYIGLPLAFLVLIREMQMGGYIAATIILAVAASDVFAYFAGSLFGRHKLAPAISPKKSWEGLIAGIVGSVGVWWLLAGIIHADFGFWVALVLGSITALAGLMGDLFESRIKREAGVKDSGNCLPGHGGMLDRIDASLAALSLAFMLISTVGVQLGVVTL